MKTSHALMRIPCALAMIAAFVAAGCSKKVEPPEPPVTPTTTLAPPATDAPAPAATADSVKAARDKAEAEAATLAAEARQKTEAAAAEAKKKAESAATTAAADAKKKAEAAAAAMMKKPAASTPAAPAETAQPAPVAPAAAAPSTMANMAASASAASGSTMDALKVQAEQLLSEYSDELATLKNGATKLKGIIDQNAGMLPAGVSEKYQEFNALLPGLSKMVDALKDYQNADLTTLVPKLKTDFSEAQKLYTELKAMVPAM